MDLYLRMWRVEWKMSTDELSKVYEIWMKLKNEVKKVIVGMDEILEEIFITLLCQGHILLEGPPGIAKTTMAKTVASILDLDFKRIQFTPDLLPSDIIGVKIFNQIKGEFVTKKGPIFANLILADEINRASPKTQSALLEAMQERQVTIEGETYELPDPFLVIATENPVEVEGTYPLPSAQLDRFLIKSIIGYPSKDDYITIMDMYGGYNVYHADKVVSKEDIRDIQKAIDKVILSKELLDYIASIIKVIEENNNVKWGISPRGGIAVAKASKAYALMNRRDYVTPEDIKRVLKPVLNHRIILSPEALFKGITPTDIIDDAIHRVSVPI